MEIALLVGFSDWGAPICTEGAKLWGSGGEALGSIFRVPPFVLWQRPTVICLKVGNPQIQIHVFSAKTKNLGQY